MKPLLPVLLLLCVSMVAPADDLRWHRTGPVAGTINSILPDRAHPGVFYLVDNSSPDYYYGYDLRRSTDNGQSWQRIPIPGVLNVMVHSASSEVFVTRRGANNKYNLLVSDDLGRTFRLRSGHAPQKIFDHPTNPNILWGSGLSYPDQELSVSYDRGAHWKAFTNLPYKFGKDYDIDGETMPLDSYDLQSVLVSPLDSRTVFVSTNVDFSAGCSGTSITLELASINDGKSWASTEFPPTRYFFDPDFPDRAFAVSYDLVRFLTPAGWKRLTAPALRNIVQVPGRPSLLYGLSGTKQWISHDGGSHWNRTNIGPGGNADVLAARSSPPESFLAGTSGGGLYVMDHGNVRQVTAGFDAARVIDVATAPGSSAVYAITADNDSFVYRSLNSGRTWTNITDRMTRPPNQREIPHILADPQNGRHVFVIVNDAAQVSFDAGQTWRDVPLKHVIGVFFNPQSATVYVAKMAFGHLFQSSDGGLTLQELPASFGGPKNTILDLAVDPLNGYLYAATNHGLFVSRDGGRTAVQIATQVNPDCLTCVPYNQIVVLPARGQFLAVTDGAIYKSVNEGVTWKLLFQPGGRIYVADYKGQHLFMIGRGYENEGRLFESFDGGQSWDPKSASVDPSLAPNTNNYITALTDPRYRPLFLSSTAGMFRAD